MELHVPETRLQQQRRQRLATEELDMAPIKQWIGMLVPAIRQRGRQILPIPVIRRRTEEVTARLGRRETPSQEAARIVQVLNHLRAVHQVEGLFTRL